MPSISNNLRHPWMMQPRFAAMGVLMSPGAQRIDTIAAGSEIGGLRVVGLLAQIKQTMVLLLEQQFKPAVFWLRWRLPGLATCDNVRNVALRKGE